VERLVIGCSDAIGARQCGRRRAVLALVGDLAERQVFGEATRGELLGGACEEREEGAPGRIGARRPAREVDGDLRSSERLDDVRAVARCAEEDGHPVERRSGLGGLGEDEPRDLHALTALAGRREHRHGFVGDPGALGGGCTEEA